MSTSEEMTETIPGGEHGSMTESGELYRSRQRFEETGRSFVADNKHEITGHNLMTRLKNRFDRTERPVSERDHIEYKSAKKRPVHNEIRERGPQIRFQARKREMGSKLFEANRPWSPSNPDQEVD